MNYGLFMSASGTLNALYRMDVAANNLANSETAGFKPEITTTQFRQSASIEDGLDLPSNALLEKLGGGVFAAPNKVNWRPGALETTKNDLDIAILGNGFFRIRSGDGSKSGITRDGRLSLNASGQLVQASSGMLVANDSGDPITIRTNAPVRIDGRGIISQNGNIVGRIGFVDVPDSQRDGLRKQGESMYKLDEGVETTPATGQIVQRSIEKSSADPIRVMLDISQAERAASSGSRMIQIHDEVMQRAITTFGRLA